MNQRLHKACASKSYYESPKHAEAEGFLSNKYHPSKSRVWSHVLALELPRVSK